VEAALRVLDAEGLDGLSIRRLGSELNAGATSVYWHVRDKEELLDLALDEVLGRIQLPQPTEDWRTDLEACAVELRRVLLAHPYAVALMLSRPAIGPKTLRAVEFALATLHRAGFTGVDVFFAYSAVITYVTGEASQEVAWAQGAQAADVDAEAAWKATTDYLGSLDPKVYPTLLAQAPHMFSHDQEAQFRFGLATVLDGLKARLTVTKSAPAEKPRKPRR
jgi:AcrR family transcriptional regulator